MSWLKLFVFRLGLISALALSLATAPVHATQDSTRGGQLITADCLRLLTEEQILAKHIANSSEDLQRLLDHHEEQIKATEQLLNGKAPAGHRIHVLLQIAIKHLNEKQWHMTGTEEYLETFHNVLHQFLKANPQFGSVLANDYKTHFVLSPLDNASFKQLVVETVANRVATIMNTRNQAINWNDWISTSLFHGAGESPADAYFRVGLRRAVYDKVDENISIEEWRNVVLLRRTLLVATSAKHGVKWETVLAVANRYIGRGEHNIRALRKWLTIKHMPEVLPELLNYFDNLRVADFHPLAEPRGVPTLAEAFLSLKRVNPLASPRSNWTVERRALFLAAADASHVVVTDIRDLGSIARRFQDAWIANGAMLEDLPSVYAHSTEAIEMIFAETFLRIKKVLGTDSKLHVYRSGDDGVWLLPDMHAPQLAAIKEIFTDLGERGQSHTTLSLKLHYSDLVSIDKTRAPNEGAAEALMKARSSLTSAKEKTKKMKLPR